jgi:hypothetical protein
MGLFTLLGYTAGCLNESVEMAWSYKLGVFKGRGVYHIKTIEFCYKRKFAC